MSGIAKFTPEELEELRKADAAIDAEDDALLEDELDAKLDAHAVAQRPRDHVLTPERVEENRAKAREYYYAHRAERLAYCKAYNAAHRKEHREYERQYYRDHKEQYTKNGKRWANEHPEKVREINRRAKANYDDRKAARERDAEQSA